MTLGYETKTAQRESITSPPRRKIFRADNYRFFFFDIVGLISLRICTNGIKRLTGLVTKRCQLGRWKATRNERPERFLRTGACGYRVTTTRQLNPPYQFPSVLLINKWRRLV